GAVLVSATASPAADTDCADHLTVHHNGNPARIRKKSELHQLPRLSVGIVCESRRADRRGLTRLYTALRLQHRRTNIRVDLTVASFLMDERTVRIDDVNRRGSAVLRSPGAARLRNLLCGFTGNLIGIENIRSGASRNDEFGRQRRVRSHP